MPNFPGVGQVIMPSTVIILPIFLIGGSRAGRSGGQAEGGALVSASIEHAGAMAEGDPMGDDPADLKIILLGDSAVGQHRDFLLRRVRQTKKLNGIQSGTCTERVEL